MRRREFIALLGGAAVVWPPAALAQGMQTRRIGVLLALSDTDPEARAWLAAFEDGLQALGWSKGRNLQIDYRWAPGDDPRLQMLAAELVAIAPDLIFAGPTPAVSALHAETSTVPLVFVQVSDPVRLGFVASLQRPGGNITGFANYEHSIAGKWLELLKHAAPGRSRVAVIFDSKVSSQPPYLQSIETAAPSIGVKVTFVDVHDAADIERAVNAFAQQPNGSMVIVPSPLTILDRDHIIMLAARHSLPTVYPYRFFASSGGFMSYGIDLADQYRRAATYVDAILKGAKPGDLPVQLSTRFELVVNLKVAKMLGLTMPESFLQQADKIIE